MYSRPKNLKQNCEFLIVVVHVSKGWLDFEEAISVKIKSIHFYGVFKKGLLEEEDLSLTSTFSCNSQIFSGGHKYFFKVIKSKPAKIT